MIIHRKEVRRLARAAADAGWDVKRTGGGHLRFLPPEGKPLFMSSTPSDFRAVTNFRAQLRRSGLQL